MERKLHYKDIVLDQPVYSEVRSRDEILDNFEVDFLGHKFKSVAIPANMACSIDFKTAEKLDENGYFYILHRFYDYDEILNWLESRQKHGRLTYNDRACVNSISVGVKQRDKSFISEIVTRNLHVDFITIDIAFGHSILMKEMIEFICHVFANNPPKIIAGNVCTPNAVEDLVRWGADSVKVGLSMGKACTTYNSTGVGSPMFSAVKNCAFSWNWVTEHDLRKTLKNLPIIADGGIRERGDVCKALVAGATMVMIGSEFVKCIDSPAKDVYGFVKVSDGRGYYTTEKKITHKKYFGSASAKNKGHKKYVEGADEVLLPVNEMKYLDYMDYVNQGIASCMSYHNLRGINLMPNIKYSVHSM